MAKIVFLETMMTKNNRIYPVEYQESEFYIRKQKYNPVKRLVYEVCKFFGWKLWSDAEQRVMDFWIVPKQATEYVYVDFTLTSKGCHFDH